MMFAYWCVLAAGILPLGCAYLAKFARYAGAEPEDRSTRFDNRDPRAWLARQTGPRARANAAMANGFEALPLFAAGVVIAALQHASVGAVNGLAGVFIAARVAFIAFYVADRATARSFAWLIGFAATVGLFVAAGFGQGTPG